VTERADREGGHSSSARPLSRPLPPYRDGYVHVLSERCATCIFRPGNLMELRPGRLADLVQQNRARDAAVPCHSTLDDEQALCRGYVDAYTQHSATLQLAHRLNVIRYVPPPPKGEPDA